MQQPTYYMRQNVGGMTNLLDAMETSEVRQLVFSSSAAVYGVPDVGAVDAAVMPADQSSVSAHADLRMISATSVDAWVPSPDDCSSTARAE